MQLPSFISPNTIRNEYKSSFIDYYAVCMEDEAYRQLLLKIPKSEHNIFLVDFENEIWRRRYTLCKYRERIRRGGNSKFWSRRKFNCLEALRILIKRRNIASILFAENKLAL